jgi:hypothetical protein
MEYTSLSQPPVEPSMARRGATSVSSVVVELSACLVYRQHNHFHPQSGRTTSAAELRTAGNQLAYPVPLVV